MRIGFPFEKFYFVLSKMVLVIITLIAIGVVSFWFFRFQLSSFFTYLSVRIERRAKDFQILNSLRQSLIHERKKKMAGLEMILSSWEKGEEIRSAKREILTSL